MSSSSRTVKEVNFHDLWPVVLGTVRSVINMSRYGHTNKSTWQARFFDIYNLCTASPCSYSEQLYEETKKFLEDHCRSIRKEIEESEQNTLSVYVKNWNEFRIGAEHLNYLYSHLNTQYVKKRPMSDTPDNSLKDFIIELNEQSAIEVGELALDCWTKIILQSLNDRIVKLVLEQIYKDRIGECVNQTTIKNVIMSLVNVYEHRNVNSLELYEKYFEVRFLQETGEYYREEGNRYLNELNCIQYMKKILLLIDEEEFRSRKFLNSTSYIKVRRECLQRLVCDHFDILKNECNDFVVKEDLNALHNMYTLLKPTDIGINYMVQRLQDNITHIGCEQVQSLKGENLPKLFVETLLELYNKYRNIIRTTFLNDPDFISSLDKAFAIIVNMKNENILSAKASELLVIYCDNLLRNSSKSLNENEIEEKLLNTIILFKYVDEKDYFQRFYQKLLARRLINQHSSSMDAEEFMVNKLRETCGYEFTVKFTRMFQDIKISDDLRNKFLDYLQKETKSNKQNPTITNLIGLDFNIFVLQTNSWPISPSANNEFIIPQLLEKPRRTFETFYNKQHNGRKLCWIYNLSNGEIRMSHCDRPYFISMGTYQMAILLLFNDRRELIFNEIEELTKLRPEELGKQITTLIENKILLCDTSDLTSNSLVSINFRFQNKRTKFRITPTTTQKEINQDSKSSQKSVEDDRKFFLQAAIVRIMKSTKKIKHNTLIEGVIKQADQRFTPSVNLIKKCIEILIDKQYLTRESSDEYSYNA